MMTSSLSLLLLNLKLNNAQAPQWSGPDCQSDRLEILFGADRKCQANVN